TQDWHLGTVGGSNLRLTPVLARITVDTVLSPPNRLLSGVTMMSDGDARLEVGAAEYDRALVVQGARWVEISNGRHAFTASPTSVPRLIHGRRFAAMITGTESVFFANHRDLDRLELPVLLQTFHARGEDEARYDVDFRTHVDGQAPLDRSGIGWTAGQTGGTPARLTIGKPLDTAAGPDENRLHLGTVGGAGLSTASIALHLPADVRDTPPLLRVRRHDDAIDLGFHFADHRLVVTNTTSTLFAGPDGLCAVRLHPQHIQEEVFADPRPAPAPATGLAATTWKALVGLVNTLTAGPAPLRLRTLGSGLAYAAAGVTTRAARTRASGASRIVFTTEGGPRSLPLSVTALTDWRNLRLQVHPRVTWADLPLDDQIERIGITTDSTREEAREQVRRSLTEPAADQTALELVTGLQFSPNGDARFRVPIKTALVEGAPTGAAARRTTDPDGSVETALWTT
ncbi:MAG: hypothetical protein ACK5XN_29925, partial [Bacteroidota bacterium]